MSSEQCSGKKTRPSAWRRPEILGVNQRTVQPQIRQRTRIRQHVRPHRASHHLQSPGYAPRHVGAVAFASSESARLRFTMIGLTGWKRERSNLSITVHCVNRRERYRLAEWALLGGQTMPSTR